VEDVVAPRPTVEIGALELFVELLLQVEEDPTSDAFYGRLAEAVCRLAAMDRAVIFRYDEARRRVRAAGAYKLDLAAFEEEHVTVESAPVARMALEQDRVIEVHEFDEAVVPARFKPLMRDSTLVCVPLSAAGRWTGVILADRGPGPRPLDPTERQLLWTLGKTAALAAAARSATFVQQQAVQLQERIDLAREVHDSAIQRLFGVLLALSAGVPLDDDARDRCAAEVQAALKDLRRALRRPLGRSAPETQTTLMAELERLAQQHPDLGVVRGDGEVLVPDHLEPLVQSVLAEAVRNAHRHARPTRVEVSLASADGALVMEVVNDGVSGADARKAPGMGLRLAALEALQVGGLVEFGPREPGTWRVRLAVPLEA
jgi:signal transduction histidine kinase